MSPSELVLNVIRQAARALRRSPGFTAAVVATLALGVGANTAVFALARHALLRPLPYPESDALVAVGTSHKEGVEWESMDYNVAAWQRANRTLTAVAWVRDRGRAVVDTRSPERVRGSRASSNLLEVLRVRPALGRWFTADEERQMAPVVVLSYALWQRRFGGAPSVLGRAALDVDDRHLTVIGVLPAGVGYPTNTEFWYPYADNLSVEVIGRTRPGVSVADVQRELRALAPGIELNARYGNSIDFVVVSLHTRLYGPNGPVQRVLLGTVLLLLVLACTNVASLSLARSLERTREMAVRIALGASRGLLTLQAIAENTLLAFAGGAAGLVFAAWVTGLLVRLSPTELPGIRGAGIGAESVAFAAGAAMLAAFVISVAPVLAVARGDLRPAMGQPGALGRRDGMRGRAREMLVVGQLAIAIILLTGAGLLIRSMARLTRIDPGFERHGLVLVQFRLGGARYETVERRRALVDELVTRVRTVPGVRSVAVGPAPLVGGRGPTFREGYDNIYAVRDSTTPGAPRHNVWVKYVDPSYLETFQIRVRVGRGIATTDDASAPAVALVNAAAERLLFPDGPALGSQLTRMPQSTAEHTSGGRPITVVGLLPDVRQRDVTIPASPEIWLPLAQQDDRYRDVSVSVRTDGNSEALVRRVRRTLAALDPELELRRLSTMDAILRETLSPQRYVLVAVGAFAALALVLAALGLYAVTAYVAAARTREIGVRMALGARPGQVGWMVLRGGLRLAALGTAIGLPVAYGVSGVLAGFLYEIDPRAAPTFLGGPAVLGLTALIAAFLPARRATRVDPVTALRAD